MPSPTKFSRVGPADTLPKREFIEETTVSSIRFYEYRVCTAAQRAGPEIRSAPSREHTSHAPGGLVLPDGIHGRFRRPGGYGTGDDAHPRWKVRRTSQS